MHTDSSKNDVLYKHLNVLCTCYSTGEFEPLFPLLAENCVCESQWVLKPHTGKEVVKDYYRTKGTLMRKSGSRIEGFIVELVGNMNTLKNADVHVNGGKVSRASVGLWYPEGKLAALLCQKLPGEIIRMIVDIQLDENDLISRIDLCMPELFKYRYLDDSSEIEEEEGV